MSGNDNRAERQLSELASLLPVPAARDLPPGRQRMLKEHLMTELHQSEPRHQEPKGRARAAGRRGQRPRGLLAVAGAGALAVAVAATVFVATRPTTLSHRTTTPTPTAAESAAVLLAKVADAAASQPAPAVRNNQFMYIRSEESDQPGQKPYERQVWLPVADVCVPGLLEEGGASTPLAPYNVGYRNGKFYYAYPSTPSAAKKLGLNFTCPSEGHLGDTYRLLQSLPTSPAALLNYLKAQEKYTNDGPLQEIFDTLLENIVPPAVAAALYRVAAQLPGATVVPDATNALGQHGMAITWPASNPRADHYELIFDRKTLQNIGAEQFNAKTGAVDFEIAPVRRAFVDKAGELP